MLFNKFVEPERKRDGSTIYKELSTAIAEANRLFHRNFVNEAADALRNRFDVHTEGLTQALAALHPDQSDFIEKRLSWDNQFIRNGLESSLQNSLERGDTLYTAIRDRLVHLQDNLERFGKLIKPGIGSELGAMIIGALTGGVLAYAGLGNDAIVKPAVNFTVGKWNDWKTKADGVFGEEYASTLYEVPELCAKLNTLLRQAFRSGMDYYVEHKAKHFLLAANAMSELSKAGCDVAPSIAAVEASVIDFAQIIGLRIHLTEELRLRGEE